MNESGSWKEAAIEHALVMGRLSEAKKELTTLLDEHRSDVALLDRWLSSGWVHFSKEGFVALKRLCNFWHTLDEPGGKLELLLKKIITETTLEEK